MLKIKNKAFTLVELIVVIVILAILATIAFLSFDSYSSKSRDSVRLSDITNITKGLELFQIKAGNYPTPMNSLIYTGGLNGINIITQGTINGNVIGLSKSNPTDPLTNNSYTYSILGNGYNYQIYGELENTLSYIDKANNMLYADNGVNSKVALIKGNYLFDPSLPSLIVIPSSVPNISGSGGIFSSDVCFVTNSNTTNILSTPNSSNCIKKKLTNLNAIDSSLVGYWDMETCSPNCSTSGGILKDLSGNGNNGNIFGNNIISTGGIAGKGLSFSGDTLSYVEINKDTGSLLNNEEITVVTNFNAKITTSWGWVIGDTFLCGGSNRCSNFQLGTTNNSFNPSLIMGTSQNNSINGYYSVNSAQDFDSKFINVILTRKEGKVSLYFNGKKVNESNYDRNLFFPNNKPYRLGVSMLNPASVKLFGILDDLKIYNRILSDTEIKQQAKAIGF